MFLCRFAGGVPPFFAVWGGQTEREAPLADFKLHAARVRVCVGLAALVGVLSGVGGKPFLQVGVVGADIVEHQIKCTKEIKLNAKRNNVKFHSIQII